MLKTRVITAVVLLAVFLPSLFFLPPFPWAILAAVVAGLAAWEWAGLLALPATSRVAYGVAVGLAGAVIAWAAPALIGTAGEAPSGAVTAALAIYAAAALFWVGVAPAWLSRKWRFGSPVLGMAVGLVVVFPAWLALVQLRTLGPGILLAILAVVWIADIAAYFSGKAFGRRKLAPSISPGKTWEGAIGATLAVVAYGLAMRHLLGLHGVSLGLWLPGLLAVTAVSVLGDLFESLLKRQAGIKDSSHILPGHGGVLDRIDSLTSTLPMVALLWLLFSRIYA